MLAFLLLGAMSAPHLAFTHTPPAATYGRTALFSWHVTPAQRVAYRCRLDVAPARPCGPRLVLRNLRAGRHHQLVVRAYRLHAGRVSRTAFAARAYRWKVAVHVYPTWQVSWADGTPPYGWATASALPRNHPDSLQLVTSLDDAGTTVQPVDGPAMALFRVYPDSAPRPGDAATHRSRALLTNGNDGTSAQPGIDRSGGNPGQVSWYRFSDYYAVHMNPNPQGWNITDQFHQVGGGETANLNVSIDGDTGVARIAVHGGPAMTGRQWTLGPIPPFATGHGGWWTYVLGVRWSDQASGAQAGWIDLWLDRHDGHGFVHLIDHRRPAEVGAGGTDVANGGGAGAATQYPVSAAVPKPGVFASTGYYRGPFGGLGHDQGPWTGIRVAGDEPGVSLVLHGGWARYPANPLLLP